MTRLVATFAALNRPAFVTYVMAGDPDREASMRILRALPEAGADVIELGMPFSDPMADGPAIQAAGLRAIRNGQTVARTLQMVREFRAGDANGAQGGEGNDATPIVLMGYYNPIYRYGVDRFVADAVEAGVDGLIVVDLPPEMDDELCLPAREAGLDFIRLATPTTDDRRLPAVLRHASGFVYYVSIAGVTGSAAPVASDVSAAVARIKRHTELPVCVGFGVRTASQAASIGAHADGVVVGSALVGAVADTLEGGADEGGDPAEAVAMLVRSIAGGLRGTAKTAE